MAIKTVDRPRVPQRRDWTKISDKVNGMQPMQAVSVTLPKDVDMKTLRSVVLTNFRRSNKDSSKKLRTKSTGKALLCWFE